MNSLELIPLHDGFSYREISPEEDLAFARAHLRTIFGDGVAFNMMKALTDKEKEARVELTQNLKDCYVLRLGFFYEDKMIGWFQGEQRGKEDFNMNITGILPAYRNRRLYSSILPLVLKKAEEKGFLRVISSHLSTNNAILVPKLKKGFMITGMSMSLKWGWMVDLSYYFNPLLQQAANFRSGHGTPAPEIKPYLNIFPKNPQG